MSARAILAVILVFACVVACRAKVQLDDPNSTSDSDPGGDPGTDDDPLPPGPPCTSLRVETFATATTIAPPSGGLPAAGTVFTIAATAVDIKRISAATDEGGFSSFFTNGYSRWSPASRTGEYVTAFGDGGNAAIYRLADRTVIETLSVGEPNELHWDRSGVASGP